MTLSCSLHDTSFPTGNQRSYARHLHQSTELSLLRGSNDRTVQIVSHNLPSIKHHTANSDALAAYREPENEMRGPVLGDDAGPRVTVRQHQPHRPSLQASAPSRASILISCSGVSVKSSSSRLDWMCSRLLDCGMTACKLHTCSDQQFELSKRRSMLDRMCSNAGSTAHHAALEGPLQDDLRIGPVNLLSDHLPIGKHIFRCFNPE